MTSAPSNSPPRMPAALLDAIVRDALDPSYAQAAARHREADSARGVSPQSRPHHRVSGLLLIVGAGLVIGLAVAFAHKTAPQVSSARNALAGDASASSRQVDDLQRQLTSLQQQVTALQQQQLQTSESGRAAAQLAERLSAAAGQTAVTGPGVILTVSDVDATRTPGAGSRPGSLPAAPGLVTDRDLQNLVNALWANGAEAIAVGGIRLGPTTAIRTAGQTILVQFRALTSPYEISAIGGPGLLERVNRAPALAEVRSGPAGSHPRLAITASQKLMLPAAAPAQPGSARPLSSGGRS